MREDARATTVLLVGALLVRLALSGAYTRYVRPGMGWMLLAAGLLLAGLGLAGVVRALRHGGEPPARGRTRRDRDEHGDHGEHGDRDEHGEHGERAGGDEAGSGRGTGGHARGDHSDHGDHGHAHGDRVAWLLLAPVLALLLVTPPALGSFGVGRGAAVNVSSGGRTFAPLPAGRTVPMTLLEFDERAADHDGASFGTTPVRLTGFVSDPSDGPGFRLARYQIACCAADAVASVVRVVGAAGDAPGRDRWVTVTGTFQRSADGIPRLRATSLAEIRPPADPYE